MKEIIVTRSKSVYQTLLLLSPIGLFFTGRSLIRNLQASEYVWWLIILLSLVSLALLYLLGMSWSRVRSNQPALRLTREGLEDNISLPKPGLIPWKEIKKCEIKKYTGSPHLLIHVKDPEAMISQLNFFQQKMAQQMIADIGTPISINPKLIQYKVEDLRDVINRKARGK